MHLGKPLVEALDNCPGCERGLGLKPKESSMAAKKGFETDLDRKRG